MTLNVDNETEDKLDFDYEELLSKVVEACLDYEACPYETEISILFTDDEGIKAINKQFRLLDAATDVLSFPAINYGKPGDFSGLETGAEDYFHPETRELILGDIVISLERARYQAEEFGHSMIREVAFLTTHSMLHLMGYDHIREEERVIMEVKQDEIMEKLQIFRK